MPNRNTQMKGVQAALLAGEPVNQVEAIRRGWGLRLGALVHRLRGRGWPIHTERVDNNGLALYSLPDDWKPPQTPDQEKPRSPQNDRGLS